MWFNQSVTEPVTGAHRRARAASRGIGACLGFLGGILYGGFVLSAAPGGLAQDSITAKVSLLLFAVAGAAAIALLAPLVTIDAFFWLQEFLDTSPAADIFGAVIGLLIALVIAAMVSILVAALPYGIGFGISIILAGVLSYVGIRTGRRRQHAFRAMLTPRPGADVGVAVGDAEPQPQDGAPIVVDTSVLIDGRIADVAKTGFIQGRLIIPSFVLEELQRVADSADAQRRGRGRRGLETVDALKRGTHVVCEILELDFPNTAEVDARLIKLARIRNAALITQDYNLNRLASIEGIRILNLNELANALKPIAASGESINVRIVKEGKEPNQGVGYLEDGTMVVVEGGRDHIEETVSATVASVLQTAAGRLIFAQLSEARPARAARSRGESPAVNP